MKTGWLDTATRGLWGAADLFAAALTESKDVANEEKAAAERERRRSKAPDPAPASSR